MGLSKEKGQRRKLKGFLMGVLGSCLLVLGSAERSSAQTFAEWFAQKKTLIKYLTEQVASLQQYGSYVKQGYAISQNGLGSIGNWLNSEYGLHNAYYSSRYQVNPVITANGKADSVVHLANLTVKSFDGLGRPDGLDAEVQRYLAAVRASVLKACGDDLAELELIVTDGEAGLSDDERLRRLEDIYARVRDRCAFSTAFAKQVRVLLLQHDRELKDLETLKRLYEQP